MSLYCLQETQTRILSSDLYNLSQMSGFGNGGSITSHSVNSERNLPRANTMPGGINYAKRLWTSTRQQIDRAKTERRTPKSHTDIRAQLFNDRISDKKKLKMLYRIATVKHDGTIEVDVPNNMEPDSSEYTFVDGAKEEVVVSTSFSNLQIVILIVGTRGDVQPFVAIGKRLKEYGHRVRLATHANFREFVLNAGLEFYPLGGDAKLLAEYMVKNKGFLPSSPREILIHRKQMKEIIFSLFPACTKPDLDSGIPFRAEAIIANPPAFGHIHVAEALNVPVHIIFTMPWTPTSEFPHPLSRVKHPVGYRLSYQVVDSMIWLGIRDIINNFRKKQLNLRPVTYISDSDIPHGYIWSSRLVPKPKDWGPKIDVVGFCFLDLASNYEPPVELLKWLNAGEKPIYIGFGSLPVQDEDTEKLFAVILRTLLVTKQRAVIDKGWSDLDTYQVPELFDSVYLLDNVPHDWLFLQCKAVVHHGGAGTTATGLKAACPTTVIPFFGDQQFWGDRVHATGVGPAPIPIDQLTSPKLIDAINYMVKPDVKKQAVEFARCMESEDGVEGAVNAFFKHLPCKMPMTSDFIPQEQPISQAKEFLNCFTCA